MERVILHVDMNAFYASVECLHRPEIRELPVAVGGDEAQRNGIILAKNQKAKKAGVKTGEALWEARLKCPDLHIVPPNYPLYIRYSRLARQIYNTYTQQVEPFGLDEAWLDITGRNGPRVAEEIRTRIKDELGVTVSIGIAWCKVFAKLGSDMNKPNACTHITKENYRDLVWPLPVDDLLYVGRATGRKLRSLGISRIGELAVLPESYLRARFGKIGSLLHHFANGTEDGAVKDYVYENPIKSIGNSVTTPRDLLNERDAKIVFYALCESVGARLREEGLSASGLGIVVRGNDLVYEQYQCMLPRASNLTEELIEATLLLFRENFYWPSPIRSLGVRAFALQAENPAQMAFFRDERTRDKTLYLDRTIDQMRERYGYGSLSRALMLCDPLGRIDAKGSHTIAPISYFKNGETVG